MGSGRRIGATVSAMIVAMQLGSPLAAEPTVEQLSQIKELLATNNVAALRTYVSRNPELAQGDDELAVLLRRYLLEAKHLPNMLSDSAPADTPSRSAQSPGAGNDDDDNGSY